MAFSLDDRPLIAGLKSGLLMSFNPLEWSFDDFGLVALLLIVVAWIAALSPAHQSPLAVRRSASKANRVASRVSPSWN